MEFSIAYVESANRAAIRNLEGAKGILGPEKIVELSFLSAENPQLVIWSDNIEHESEEKETLIGKNIQVSIPASQIGFSSNAWENLDSQQAHDIFQEHYPRWLLKNNLETLEHLFSLQARFNGLFANERTLFFEEIWFLLKRNLGAIEIKLIYNDLDIVNTGAGEKNKLVQMVLEGGACPNSRAALPAESKLMEHYTSKMLPIFEIKQFDEEKGELFILASINKGPILLMVKMFSLSKLQRIVLKLIFEGLQS
jgi:hypothetical protein